MQPNVSKAYNKTQQTNNIIKVNITLTYKHVALTFTKSPPCIMKSFITLQKQQF